MLRLIIRTDDAGMAANVGGSVLTTFHTIDIEHPEIEELLRAKGAGSFAHTQIVGAELIATGGEDVRR